MNNDSKYCQSKTERALLTESGWEWEARIVERRCKFTVDGVEGYGISECEYRNHGGRAEEFAKSDPAWVKTVKTT
jgi:hypothetical protein